MKMSDNEIRFMIATDRGSRSNSWRIWTRNNDCYMGPRGIAQDYKASFHESGQCQIGLSREIRETLISEPSWKGQSRLFDVWSVENNEEYGEKVKLIELLFPFSHLDDFDKTISGNEVVLRCGEGQIASVAAFRIGAGSVVKSDDRSISEIGRLPLKSGQWIAVLHRVFEETDEYLEFFERTAKSFKQPSEKSIGSGRTYQKGYIDVNKPGLRVMLGYKNSNGRYWIEMSYTKLMAAESTR